MRSRMVVIMYCYSKWGKPSSRAAAIYMESTEDGYQKPCPLYTYSLRKREDLRRTMYDTWDARSHYAKDIRLLLGCYLVPRVYRYYSPNKNWRHERPTTNYMYLVQHDVNGCIAHSVCANIRKVGWWQLDGPLSRILLPEEALAAIYVLRVHATTLGPTENGLPTINI